MAAQLERQAAAAVVEAAEEAAEEVEEFSVSGQGRLQGRCRLNSAGAPSARPWIAWKLAR